jgi:hypothetical protein
MASSDFVNCYACNANDTIDSDAWVWADMHGNVWADPDDKEPWCVGCLPAQQDDAPTKGGTMKANRDCAFCMDPRATRTSTWPSTLTARPTRASMR